ncbi:cytidylate kinase-like family protein [Ekhidna sp.]|uniref:cytidylate kinase-like family protein n=1 Tax=Ekhidna sp. TaxID=2608089 RepID=UPI0032EF237A
MAKIDLKEYLDERDKIRESEQVPGPVITISREHGCDANNITRLLIKKLAGPIYKDSKTWKAINKEILEDAAHDLKLSERKIRGFMDKSAESAAEDLFASFSQHYGTNSKKILETLRDVIWSYAVEGHVIIVGRGGAHIAKHIDKSLHVKLQAPRKWRVSQVQKKWSLSPQEAELQCRVIDEKRTTWINQLSRDLVGDAVYDLVLNTQTLQPHQIIEVILMAMESKGIIHSEKQLV